MIVCAACPLPGQAAHFFLEDAARGMRAEAFLGGEGGGVGWRGW